MRSPSLLVSFEVKVSPLTHTDVARKVRVRIVHCADTKTCQVEMSEATDALGHPIWQPVTDPVVIQKTLDALATKYRQTLPPSVIDDV